MRGRTTSVLILSFTLLSTFLLLGSLTSASSDLSRMEATPTTTSRTASSSATGLHELGVDPSTVETPQGIQVRARTEGEVSS